MTLREAYDAGIRGVPIVYDGIKFKRILRCGYAFTGQGVIIPYAELMSYIDSSVVVAKVDSVELYKEEQEVK